MAARDSKRFMIREERTRRTSLTRRATRMMRSTRSVDTSEPSVGLAANSAASASVSELLQICIELRVTKSKPETMMEKTSGKNHVFA